MRISRLRLAWTAAAVCLWALAAGVASAQTPSCQVTYTKSWEGGNGFGANIIITNNGPAITNGWTLIFNFPNGQRLQNGWPVTFTQPAGSAQMTVASNADWNKSIASGGTFTAGFNGTFTGTTNNIPTAFTLNGTACNGGTTPPTNTPPTVNLTSPTSGQQIANGATIPLAATASDTGAVSRVEFRIDGTLVNTDTTSPYGFTNPALSAGSHTAQATAFDNATPPLSTATALIPFTVLGATTGNTIVANPATVNIAGGATGTSIVRLSSAPSGNVVVTLTRSGSTVITSSPSTLTLTTANWSTGVTVTFTAAAGTTAATSTFAAAAPSITGATITVNRTAVVTGRADNPYASAGVYNNPQWRAAAVAGGGSAIANQPTAVWFDRISAITGNGSATTGSMGLVQHLNEAVTQDTANGATPMVFQMVIYDLPGRDCAALASNGELGPTDLPRYESEYIDPIAAILARPEYAALRIVAIIEIDSLPNLVTNTTDRPTGTALCDTMKQNGNYVNGVGYALAKLGAVPNVYNYIDAGHHGWLGWDTNFAPAVAMIKSAAVASGSTVNNVTGFITDTANSSALVEPYITVDSTTRTSRWIDFNQFNDELSYAQAFRTQAVSAGFPANVGMLIDTSRNGWGGAARPTGPSTLADLNARIDASRIDRRIHKGNWCNPSGAGLGERPRAAPATGIDAYVWIKPPGESDGASSVIANDEGKGFDRMCDPTYGGNARNNNNMTGALPNAPLSGHWFQAQFQQLMQNAFPPL
ncbi:MAG TPA: glycoside hydrolase family 6 protein [Steroidobacteraceae bacterium]|jgi:cellulose 1,4-beta-cellobiosidase|nr:glycoside hydrolase family 6 protein [Steroidobacteraceae bacterium]